MTSMNKGRTKMGLMQIASSAITGRSHAGNLAIGNPHIPSDSLMAMNTGYLHNSMKHKALPDDAFHISHGFLIEYLYKGYKRYMVTPVTPIRVLYTRACARKGGKL